MLPLQYLCLPSLEKLNVSHNQIHTIEDNGKVCLFPSHPSLPRPSLPCPQVLERITHLSLAHNRLRSLDGITAFVGTCVLNLAFNVISSSDDLSKLVLLRRLDVLSMAGGCGHGDTTCNALSAVYVCLFVLSAGNPISSSGAFRIVILAKFLCKSRKVGVVMGSLPWPMKGGGGALFLS